MSDLDLEYIRSTYNVPAKIGGRIEFKSRAGTIVGANGTYLRIRLDGETEINSYHPTWEMEYYPDEGSVS